MRIKGLLFAVMNRLVRKQPASLTATLGLCLGLLLAAQCLEASHLHVDAWDAPECVQCQFDTAQALPVTAAGPVLHSQVKELPESSAVSPLLRPAYRHLARGPPSISA